MQEGNLSLAKHAFHISNSGWEGSLCSRSSPCPCFLLRPVLTASSTEWIHCSQLVHRYLVRHFVRSPGSLLEVEKLMLKLVEGAEDWGKALGQLGT